MGKKSSFLPQKCKASLPHTGKDSCFLPRMLKVHPSPGSASPQNATLPFPTEGRILPPSKCKSPQILPYKLVFFSSFLFSSLPFPSLPFFPSSLFCMCVLFHYYLNFELFFFFSSLFPKTWNSSPKWKGYSAAFGANNRRIDAPEFVSNYRFLCSLTYYDSWNLASG